MKYTTLNAEDMAQNELTSICAEIQTALNCGLTELTVEMTIGVKRTLTDLIGFLEYYTGGLNYTYAKGGEITIEFEHKGKQHKLTFTPEEEDWWTAFKSKGLDFDLHYDEDDGTISVYEYSDNGTDYTNTVYSKKIMSKGGSTYELGGTIIKKGNRVRVVNTQFDGQEGLVVSNDLHNGNYQVQMKDGKVKGFPFENLMLLSRETYAGGGE